MNRYIRQSFILLNTIRKKIGQQICDRITARLIDCQRQVLDQQESPQPYSPEEREFQPNEITSTAKSNRNNNNRQHRNNHRKSKKAKWAEERRKQDIAYAEAKAKGDKEGTSEYWKWIQRYGTSTTEYYARIKAKKKAARQIARTKNQITSAEAKKRRAEIKADAQCTLPEDVMIEHLEDHRDGIGWSIAALSKKRFHVRRTLKSNDPNGDMFCEVNDNGESLLKAVKQIISRHEHSNPNK